MRERGLFSVKDTKNAVVFCNLCVSSKMLSTMKNTACKLLKHLIRQHSKVRLVKKMSSEQGWK